MHLKQYFFCLLLQYNSSIIPRKIQLKTLKTCIFKIIMYICNVIQLLIKIKLIMTQKSPTGDKIVKVLKWIAYFATAIASFITGANI